MPIYEYECKNCGYRFERLQKISDEPLKICPECQKSQLTKLISNTSFQLKGTGWYVTDFKDKKPEKTKESLEKKPKTQETKGSETKKDTKNKD